MDRLDEAIGLIAEGAKAQPLKPQQRFQLADLYSQARRVGGRCVGSLRRAQRRRPGSRVGYLERTLAVRPGDADALIALADDVGASDPKRATDALDEKRRFPTMWANDNLSLANLQIGENNFAAAATAIDAALDEAPTRADLCGKRREIDPGLKLDPAAASRLPASGAEAAARIGESALAVKLHLRTLRGADGPAPRCDDEAFEQRVAARGSSALLLRESAAVAAFWDDLAKEETTASLAEQAERERARVGDP